MSGNPTRSSLPGRPRLGRTRLSPPEHLAEEVGKLLRLGRGFVVTGGDVELAVFAEVYSPAHVVVGCLVAQPEDELLAARDDLVAVGGDAHHAVVDRGGGSSLLGVLEVDVAVGGEVGVECERLQTTLPI